MAATIPGSAGHPRHGLRDAFRAGLCGWLHGRHRQHGNVVA